MGLCVFDHVGQHVDAFQGLPAHIHRAIVEAYIGGAFHARPADEDVAGLVEPWLEDDGASSFYKQFAEADERYTAEIEPLFGEIRCAVRVFWGEADPWIPLERGRRLHAAIGRGAFVTLPDVGHMPQMEAPAAFLDTLCGFLTCD